MILEMSDTIFTEELLKRGFKYDGEVFSLGDFLTVNVDYDDGKEHVGIDVDPPNLALALMISRRMSNAQDQFSEALKIIDELMTGTFKAPDDISSPPDPADWWKK